MIKLEQITNLEVLYGALREEEIYKDILAIEDINTWIPNIISTKWFLAEEDGEYKGLLICHVETQWLWSFHGGIYERFRGESSRITGEVLQLIKDQYDVHLMTMCSTNKIHVIRLMKSLGFEQCGYVPNGYGTTDMIIYSEKK